MEAMHWPTPSAYRWRAWWGVSQGDRSAVSLHTCAGRREYVIDHSVRRVQLRLVLRGVLPLGMVPHQCIALHFQPREVRGCAEHSVGCLPVARVDRGSHEAGAVAVLLHHLEMSPDLLGLRNCRGGCVLRLVKGF